MNDGGGGQPREPSIMHRASISQRRERCVGMGRGFHSHSLRDVLNGEVDDSTEGGRDRYVLSIQLGVQCVSFYIYFFVA